MKIFQLFSHSHARLKKPVQKYFGMCPPAFPHARCSSHNHVILRPAESRLWNKFVYLRGLKPSYGRDPFNQNSNRSDREKRTTSKGGPVFRNFSGWTEPIHWVLDRNFRKVWLNGSRPISHFQGIEVRSLPSHSIFKTIHAIVFWSVPLILLICMWGLSSIYIVVHDR